MHVIYGGTFDPIHHGHLRLALEVSEALEVSRVHLVPSHIPPHRGSTGASSAQRLEMIRQAIAGEPALALDEQEVHRGGASYTADTLRQLRAELGPDCPLVMVVGTDAFSSFDRWREWQERALRPWKWRPTGLERSEDGSRWGGEMGCRNAPRGRCRRPR